MSLTWLLAAVYAGLPYLLSDERQLSQPMDAFFEGMSGFTTTGATVVTDVDALDRSILLWRQLSQWLGGMGIIVLALAVLPRLRIGGRQMFESELPGPEVNQLAERIRDTARRLWMLYIALTLVLIAALLFVGAVGLDDRLTPFDAIGNALTTMPLGGFATDNRSLEPFAPVTQWIVAAFMALAGVNFALLYRTFVRRDPTAIRRDEEARLYGVLLLLGSILVFAELVHADLFAGGEAVRQAFFQTTSLMTGTGFAITDYVSWPTLSVMAMIGLMFVGASAGSPTGSVKIVRHLLVARILRRELRQTIHPELVMPIRLNGQAVEERTLRAVLAFVVLYIGIFIVGAALLAIDARVLERQPGHHRRGRRLGRDARQRRARARVRGADGELRAVQRLLEARDGAPDVDRPPRGAAGARAADAGLLEGVGLALVARPVGEKRAHLAELPGLAHHDERVAVEDHVVGLGARDRLRLAQDRDHGDAGPLAEAAIGERPPVDPAVVRHLDPLDLELAERHLQLLDDLRPLVGAAEERAELPRLVVVQLEHDRRLLVAPAAVDVDLPVAVVVLDDGDAAPGRRASSSISRPRPAGASLSVRVASTLLHPTVKQHEAHSSAAAGRSMRPRRFDSFISTTPTVALAST